MKKEKFSFLENQDWFILHKNFEAFFTNGYFFPLRTQTRLSKEVVEKKPC